MREVDGKPAPHVVKMTTEAAASLGGMVPGPLRRARGGRLPRQPGRPLGEAGSLCGPAGADPSPDEPGERPDPRKLTVRRRHASRPSRPRSPDSLLQGPRPPRPRRHGREGRRRRGGCSGVGSLDSPKRPNRLLRARHRNMSTVPGLPSYDRRPRVDDRPQPYPAPTEAQVAPTPGRQHSKVYDVNPRLKSGPQYRQNRQNDRERRFEVADTR